MLGIKEIIAEYDIEDVLTAAATLIRMNNPSDSPLDQVAQDRAKKLIEIGEDLGSIRELKNGLKSSELVG